MHLKGLRGQKFIATNPRHFRRVDGFNAPIIEQFEGVKRARMIDRSLKNNIVVMQWRPDRMQIKRHFAVINFVVLNAPLPHGLK